MGPCVRRDDRRTEATPYSRRAPHIVGERAVGEGFGQMQAADLVGAVEVGKRARHPQHAVIARSEPVSENGFQTNSGA